MKDHMHGVETYSNIIWALTPDQPVYSQLPTHTAGLFLVDNCSVNKVYDLLVTDDTQVILKVFSVYVLLLFLQMILFK